MPFLVQIMQSPRFLTFVLGGFMIAVMASPSFPFVNGPLTMVLIISGTLLLLAISMGYYDDQCSDLRRKQRRSPYKKAEFLLIFAPSLSLSVLLLIRLFSKHHFLTIPAFLEFGPQKGDPYAYISNVAFLGGGFRSFGHWLQGFLAPFLLRFKYKRKKDDDDDDDDDDNDNDSLNGTPDGNENGDDPNMAWRCGSTPPDMSFVNIAAYLFLIYPIYSFVEQCVRTPDTFATSSYMSNGMEWALGFWTGHSAGFIADAVSYKKIHERTPRRSSDSTADSTADTATVASIISEDDTTITPGIGTIISNGTESPIRGVKQWTCPCSAKFVFLMFGWLIGILYSASIFGACIMTGLTWNTCEGELEDCVNFIPNGIPGVIAFVLTMVPTLAVCAVLL